MPSIIISALSHMRIPICKSVHMYLHNAMFICAFLHIKMFILSFDAAKFFRFHLAFFRQYFYCRKPCYPGDIRQLLTCSHTMLARQISTSFLHPNLARRPQFPTNIAAAKFGIFRPWTTTILQSVMRREPVPRGSTACP